MLSDRTNNASSAEQLIGDLPHSLRLKDVEDALRDATEHSRRSVAFLIDGLDEGYAPDVLGTALVDGLLQATIDLRTRISCVKPVVFLRDNILRAVQQNDQDYSKHIEPTVLRMHWDVESLFAFATRRFRIAFGLAPEANRKIWDACVSTEMGGVAGFKRCLQHTLYRPRDLLALLNDSIFLSARRHPTRMRLVRHDIQEAARRISISRLDDLKKEYGDILAGLPAYTAAFGGGPPSIAAKDAHDLLSTTLAQGSKQTEVQQEFDILSGPVDILKGLYSVGFIGVRDAGSGSYVFCHDGRAPSQDIGESGRILVHPCYWMALNVEDDPGSEACDAQEIYDEYDIRIASETPEIRKSRIRHILARLDDVPEGGEGSAAFEDWCADAIRICFAKGLRNVQLRPNRTARLRRDIVATNLAEDGAWRRIREDYGTRQVIFEVKNVGQLKSADYQQMLSYLGGDYGRVGFFVTRLGTIELRKGRDVEWVRDMYSQHDVLPVKITAEFLKKQLRRLESPQKHDAVDNSIHSILDSYARLYVVGQSNSSSAKQKRNERRAKRRHRREGKAGRQP